MNLDLEQLNRIQRVEAPPYLFTRIQQKIANGQTERLPKGMAVAINLSFVLILVINVIVFMRNTNKSDSTENYAQSIHLMSNNSLYK